MAGPEHENHGEPVTGERGIGESAVGAECVEWCPICRTMDVLRASTTPQVRDQWQDIQREALLTLRTLAEHYIQRLGEEQPVGPEGAKGGYEEPRRATPVEEIPIE